VYSPICLHGVDRDNYLYLPFGGGGGFFRGSDHLPVTGTEVKNGWSCNVLTLHAVMTCRLIFFVLRTDVSSEPSGTTVI
jgi:hypothetical protein